MPKTQQLINIFEKNVEKGTQLFRNINDLKTRDKHLILQIDSHNLIPSR